MNHPRDLVFSSKHDDEEDSNHSPNPTFDAIVQARLNRRSMLRGGVGAMATALFGGVGLAACGGGDDDDDPVAPAPTETLLGFTAVAKSTADTMLVPAGYTAAAVFAVGDPLAAGLAAAANNGSDSRLRPAQRRQPRRHGVLRPVGERRARPDQQRPRAAGHQPRVHQRAFPARQRPVAEPASGIGDRHRGRCARRRRSSSSPRPAATSPTCRARPSTAASPRRPRSNLGLCARQCAVGDDVLPRRHEDPRHRQQLRHRQDALGHAADRRGELGRLLLPRRQRHRCAQRQGQHRAGALWPQRHRHGRGRQPLRLGDRRRRRQVRALEHQRHRRVDRRQRRLPPRGQRPGLHDRDRSLQPGLGGQEAHVVGTHGARERGLRQARGRQAAGGLHGRRCAQRVHLQVRLDAELGGGRCHRERPRGHRRQVPRRRQALRREVQRRRHRPVAGAEPGQCHSGRLRELRVRRRGRRGAALAHRRRRRGRDQDGPARVVRRQPDHAARSTSR